MDKWGWSHKKSVLVNLVVIIILSLPCLLGFNLWSGFQPFGDGSVVMDLEDFVLSDNLLPLGSLVYLLFCVSRRGWGWDNFLPRRTQATASASPPGPSLLPLCAALLVLIIFVMATGTISVPPSWPSSPETYRKKRQSGFNRTAAFFSIQEPRLS